MVQVNALSVCAGRLRGPWTRSWVAVATVRAIFSSSHGWVPCHGPSYLSPSLFRRPNSTSHSSCASAFLYSSNSSWIVVSLLHFLWKLFSQLPRVVRHHLTLPTCKFLLFQHIGQQRWTRSEIPPFFCCCCFCFHLTYSSGSIICFGKVILKGVVGRVFTWQKKRRGQCFSSPLNQNHLRQM